MKSCDIGITSKHLLNNMKRWDLPLYPHAFDDIDLNGFDEHNFIFAHVLKIMLLTTRTPTDCMPCNPVLLGPSYKESTGTQPHSVIYMAIFSKYSEADG